MAKEFGIKSKDWEGVQRRNAKKYINKRNIGRRTEKEQKDEK